MMRLEYKNLSAPNHLIFEVINLNKSLTFLIQHFNKPSKASRDPYPGLLVCNNNRNN